MSRASVGGGGCILRAPRGPVDLDRHALRVDSRLNQFKPNVRAGVGEQPRPLAEDDGDDEQVDLVDEVVLEQPPDQGAAAVHLQLTPGLAFSSPMAAARSAERTVVSAQRGSVSVFDATY